MTWQQFWAYFSNSPDDTKRYLWKQLDLESHLKGLTKKQQLEVLRGAPEEIIELVKDCIYLGVRIDLGAEKSYLAW